MMSTRFLLWPPFAAAMSACSSAEALTVADIRYYTGLTLCEGVAVHDLTLRQERNVATPGFSFHVVLQLDAACEASFRKQLAALPTSNCRASGGLSRGCFVEDAYPKAIKHTSIAVTTLGSGRYDMRFYE